MDELLTVQGASLGQPFLLHDVLVNAQGPLPHVILRLWSAVAGSGDLSLRLWAATGGILGLVLAAAAFRRILPRAAVAATWLLALSPFQIWYAQEVRNYAWLLPAAMLALWTLVRALERPGPRAWAVHAASMLALLLCNLSTLLLVPVVGVMVLLDRRERFLAWAASAAAAVLLAAPWILAEFTGNLEWSGVTGGAGVAVRGDLTFHPGAVPFTFATFVGGFGLGPPLRELHRAVGPGVLLPHLLLLVPAALATLAALAVAAGRLGRRRQRLLFAWAFLPVIAVSVVALLGLKAYNPRYLAASQPVFLLLVADGLVLLAQRRRALGGLVALALVVPMLAGWARQEFDPAYAREDYRGAAAWLEARTRPGDLILQQGVTTVLDRYYRGPARIDSWYPVFFAEPDGGRGRLEGLLAGHPRVWWVGSRLWFDDPDRELLGWLEARGEPVAAWNRTGIEVRGFRLRESGGPGR